MSLSHWNMAVAGFLVGTILTFMGCNAWWESSIDDIIKSGFIRASNAQAYQITPFHAGEAK